MSEFAIVKGGVAAPRGFRASGVFSGIKQKSPDLALVYSDRDCDVAGVFTSNKLKGWHVFLCQDRISKGEKIRAVVVNSGNANACNGQQGRKDAEKTAELAAGRLSVDSRNVMVCSTGTIGIPLPMDKIEAGIAVAAGSLDEADGFSAASAILTTDTVEKQGAVELSIDNRPVRIGAMAKGSGMIEPNMATMLAFFTTDAVVESEALSACLSEAADMSFNKISVDGDQSCNDSVLFMANGVAGNRPLNREHPEWPVFEAAVRDLAMDLALRLVRDGEGSTKLVTVRVVGAAGAADARMVARAVAGSLLVKTSWFGNEPNWGRIVNAIGYSGARIDVDKIDVSYDSECIVKSGQPVPNLDAKQFSRIIGQDEFTVNIDLNMGRYSDIVYTCDCSVDYVKINAEYMT